MRRWSPVRWAAPEAEVGTGPQQPAHERVSTRSLPREAIWCIGARAHMPGGPQEHTRTPAGLQPVPIMTTDAAPTPSGRCFVAVIPRDGMQQVSGLGEFVDQDGGLHAGIAGVVVGLVGDEEPAQGCTYRWVGVGEDSWSSSSVSALACRTPAHTGTSVK